MGLDSSQPFGAKGGEAVRVGNEWAQAQIIALSGILYKVPVEQSNLLLIATKVLWSEFHAVEELVVVRESETHSRALSAVKRPLKTV